MVIVLDGPDACGKSTLAEFLANKYGLTYEHMSSKNKNDFQEHYELYSRDNIIIDRAQGGERVYPYIFNRPSKLTDEELDRLFKYMIKRNVIYVVMYASDTDLLKKRLDVRGEQYDNIDLQNKLFKEYAEKWFKRYDYDKFILWEVTNDLSNNFNYNNLYRLMIDLCDKLEDE